METPAQPADFGLEYTDTHGVVALVAPVHLTVSLDVVAYTFGDADAAQIATTIANTVQARAGYNTEADTDSNDLVFADVRGGSFRVRPLSRGVVLTADQLADETAAAADWWHDDVTMRDVSQSPSLAAQWLAARQEHDALWADAADRNTHPDAAKVADVETRMAHIGDQMAAALGW